MYNNDFSDNLYPEMNVVYDQLAGHLMAFLCLPPSIGAVMEFAPGEDKTKKVRAVRVANGTYLKLLVKVASRPRRGLAQRSPQVFTNAKTQKLARSLVIAALEWHGMDQGCNFHNPNRT